MTEKKANFFAFVQVRKAEACREGLQRRPSPATAIFITIKRSSTFADLSDIFKCNAKNLEKS